MAAPAPKSGRTARSPSAVVRWHCRPCPVTGPTAEVSVGFLGNLSHDVASGLQLRYKADALSGPEREGINVAFDIGPRRIRLIANDGSARSRGGDHLRLTWTLARCGPACSLPGSMVLFLSVR
jgi:hypothetical protein